MVPLLSWKEKRCVSGKCGGFVCLWFLICSFGFFVLPVSLQCSGQIEFHKPGVTESRHFNVSDFFFLLESLKICWNIFLNLETAVGSNSAYLSFPYFRLLVHLQSPFLGKQKPNKRKTWSKKYTELVPLFDKSCL